MSSGATNTRRRGPGGYGKVRTHRGCGVAGDYARVAVEGHSGKISAGVDQRQNGGSIVLGDVDAAQQRLRVAIHADSRAKRIARRPVIEDLSRTETLELTRAVKLAVRINIYGWTRLSSYEGTRKRNLTAKAGLDAERTVIANDILAIGQNTKERDLSVLLKGDCPVGVVLDDVRAEKGAHSCLPATAHVDGYAQASVRGIAVVRHMGIPESSEIGLANPKRRSLVITDVSHAGPRDDVRERVGISVNAIPLVVVERTQRIYGYVGRLGDVQAVAGIAAATQCIEDNATVLHVNAFPGWICNI